MLFGEFARGERLLAPIPETNRQSVTFYQTAALVLAGQRRLSEAEALYAAALKLAPTNEIPSLYLATFGREPTADELAASLEFRQAGSLEQLAQVLLMSNEMMFLD